MLSTKAYVNRVIIATAIVFGVMGVLYLMSLAKGPLLWIFIAGFFAVAINPLVHQVARFMPKKNMALAALVVLTVGFGALALLAYLFLAPLIQQTASLAASIPALIQKGVESLTNTPFAQNLDISKSSVEQFIQNNLSDILNSAAFIGGALISLLLATIDSVIAIVAILTMIFFMTAEGKVWKDRSLRLIEPKSRARAAQIGSQVYDIITGYVVGNIILSIIFGFGSAAVLWAMGSPYWLPLSLVAMLFDLIPLVGSTIAAVVIGIISVLSGQPQIAAVYAIFVILYVQLENNVLNPMVYSKKVDVSPLIVLVSILLGGAMAGIVGALIAIPVAATLQVLARELFRDRLAQK